MRALALLLCGLLLSGCVSPAAPPPAGDGAPALTAEDIKVPSGARLEPMEGGFVAAWPPQALPIVEEFAVPHEATIVRAVLEAPDGTRLSMVNPETGRRRCNTPTAESFTTSFRSPISCSSLPLLDAPGATWRIATSGGAGATATLRVEYLSVPLDGIAGRLDLSRIDPPTLALMPTEVLTVPSFDGVPLRVEVTLPVGAGPWPTIIESSPYHDDGVRATPASWTYFVQDWAKRGYAIVVADVRGFGDSGGCVEVWGPNEQKDQAFLVEWAAGQPWSDGNIGFYGQSYVGTTPVEAASLAPPHLKAIIAVAPVINAYEDWHHGGVPDGENTGSPVAYQFLQDEAAQQRTDPRTIANNAANGVCDPTLLARANDPRAIYDQFYLERDFKRMAGSIRAATLYTQGFEDANVKSDMIPGWFNEITAPKLGLFGHWLHQHPSRADSEALFVGWMEQHLKGKEIGFDRLPAVAVVADRERHRLTGSWPPRDPMNVTLWPDFAASALSPDPAEGRAELLLDPSGLVPASPALPTRIELTVTLDRDTALAGVATVRAVGTLSGAATAYLDADLYDGRDLVGWGQFHLAHNADHTTYTPRTSQDLLAVEIPIRATEHVFEAGSTLRLVLRSVTVAESDPLGIPGARFTFHGSEDGTRLVLPTVPMAAYEPMPLTARP